jgi:UDP-N-acetylglucosamine 2-epimerase
VVLDPKPDWVPVHRDVDASIRDALIDSSFEVRVVHVEARLGSHDRSPPEEIHRLLQ